MEPAGPGPGSERDQQLAAEIASASKNAKRYTNPLWCPEAESSFSGSLTEEMRYSYATASSWYRALQETKPGTQQEGCKIQAWRAHARQAGMFFLGQQGLSAPASACNSPAAMSAKLSESVFLCRLLTRS